MCLAVRVYTWIVVRPIPDVEMNHVVQEFSHHGIVLAVPFYFNSSNFRSEWPSRPYRLLCCWRRPVLIMQGYNSRTQPREFCGGGAVNIFQTRAMLPSHILLGRHFYTLERSFETGEAIQQFLAM